MAEISSDSAPASRTPRVSVVMTVYNGDRYLEQAVDSIMRQSWKNFELICVDDGSTDRSLEILRTFESRDSRVRILSRSNTGQAEALNDGIAMARGEFIARMDADDVSLPQRLEKQIGFLELNSEVVCVSSCVFVIDPDDDLVNVFRVPLSHAEIDGRHFEQGLGGGIQHPAAMMRTRAVRDLGGYRAEYQPAEDLDLWLRMAEIGRLANVESPLLKYRLNPSGLSFTNRAKQNQRANAAVNEARRRRNRTALPPPNNSWNPSPVDLLKDAVANSRREGFWKAAQKYSWRLIRAKPTSKFGWRVLVESTFHRTFR